MADEPEDEPEDELEEDDPLDELSVEPLVEPLRLVEPEVAPGDPDDGPAELEAGPPLDPDAPEDTGPEDAGPEEPDDPWPEDCGPPLEPVPPEPGCVPIDEPDPVPPVVPPVEALGVVGGGSVKVLSEIETEDDGGCVPPPLLPPPGGVVPPPEVLLEIIQLGVENEAVSVMVLDIDSVIDSELSLDDPPPPPGPEPDERPLDPPPCGGVPVAQTGM